MQNLLVILRIGFALGFPFLAMEAGNLLTPWVKVPLAIILGLLLYLAGTWFSESPVFKASGKFLLITALLTALLIISRPIFYALHGHPIVATMGTGRVWFSAFLTLFLCFVMSLYLLYLFFSNEQTTGDDVSDEIIGSYWWAILITIAMAFLP